MKSQTVWVVNNRNHNLTEAQEYGDLKDLTNGVVNVFGIDEVLRQFKETLANSEKEDFILWCGSIPLNVLATQVMLAKHGVVHALIYDLKQKRYVCRTYTEEDVR